MAGGNVQSSSPSPQNCKAKPVFVENGQAHDYCSRTCASNYEGRQLQPCLLDTCHLTGRSAHGDFCSDEHAKYVPQEHAMNSRSDTSVTGKVSEQGRSLAARHAAFIHELREAIVCSVNVRIYRRVPKHHNHPHLRIDMRSSSMVLPSSRKVTSLLRADEHG